MLTKQNQPIDVKHMMHCTVTMVSRPWLSLQYEHKMLPPRAEMEKLEDDILKQVSTDSML